MSRFLLWLALIVVLVLAIVTEGFTAPLAPPVPDPHHYLGAQYGRCPDSAEFLLILWYVIPGEEDEYLATYRRVANGSIEAHPFALLDTRTPFVWFDADRDGVMDGGYPVETPEGYWTPIGDGPCALLDHLLARRLGRVPPA